MKNSPKEIELIQRIENRYLSLSESELRHEIFNSPESDISQIMLESGFIEFEELYLTDHLSGINFEFANNSYPIIGAAEYRPPLILKSIINKWVDSHEFSPDKKYLSDFDSVNFQKCYFGYQAVNSRDTQLANLGDAEWKMVA